MAGPLRYVDDRINTGLDRIRNELRSVWNVYSPPLRVRFVEAEQRRDIAHTLGVIPDGFLVVYTDADLIAEPGVPWTETLAYLRAGGASANAVVIFYTLREEIRDA